MKVSQEVFGQTRFGETVTRYILTNNNGMEVDVLDRGCIIQSIRVPDSSGALADVVLGCNTVADYEAESAYFGAVAGRYANRICKGRLNIEGQEYQLATNNGQNHLHGGERGFNDRIWKAESFVTESEAGIELRYCSEDGEENYPGTLDVSVRYTLNDQNELSIQYGATTDKTTVVNLTNHTYFNLRGQGTSLDHRVQLFADHFTPTDETSIPTGKIASVKDTPMDFTVAKTIRRDIDEEYSQLQMARGFDHNWVVRKTNEEAPSDPVLIARVEEPDTGRTLEVLTTQPGVQFYTGNYLEGQPARGGSQYCSNDGFCLETQHFPDSPNHNHFPSTVLIPGEEYRQITSFRFGNM
ncbi:MAG: aldose epimerase family protein [Endozoicomonas sp.]